LERRIANTGVGCTEYTKNADVSVIHGGKNAVMNACLSGTPIVGVGMHPEQQANSAKFLRQTFGEGQTTKAARTTRSQV